MKDSFGAETDAANRLLFLWIDSENQRRRITIPAFLLQDAQIEVLCQGIAGMSFPNRGTLIAEDATTPLNRLLILYRTSTEQDHILQLWRFDEGAPYPIDVEIVGQVRDEVQLQSLHALQAELFKLGQDVHLESPVIVGPQGASMATSDGLWLLQTAMEGLAPDPHFVDWDTFVDWPHLNVRHLPEEFRTSGAREAARERSRCDDFCRDLVSDWQVLRNDDEWGANPMGLFLALAELTKSDIEDQSSITISD